MKAVETYDRRGFGRRRTDIRAQVRIGYRVIACTIKDLSEGGALLEFDEQIDLPARLWLSWPDSRSEIVCEVRHSRRNTAGVQFARSASMALRPAVPLSEPAGAQLAPPLKAPEHPHATASDIVAERRRSLRPATAPAAAAVKSVEALAAGEPPRDISTLMKSLKASAAAIVEERAARAVPVPLPARHYAGAPVNPPPLPTPQAAVLPLNPAAYAGAIQVSPELVATAAAVRPLAASQFAGAVMNAPAILAPAHPVLPLAAASYRGAVGMPLPPALAPAVPLPMPAREFADSRPGSTQCQTYDCAIAGLRNLAGWPPRPLAAWVYGTDQSDLASVA